MIPLQSKSTLWRQKGKWIKAWFENWEFKDNNQFDIFRLIKFFLLILNINDYLHTTNHAQLIMRNPTTNEFHLIPRAPSLSTCYIDESLYGFGVINNDFKVVKLSLSDTIGANLSLTEVYNLSTKSWTINLNCPPLTSVTRQQPSRYNTLANGVYHWITNRCSSANILCFDFRIDVVINDQSHRLNWLFFLFHYWVFYCLGVVIIIKKKIMLQYSV